MITTLVAKPFKSQVNATLLEKAVQAVFEIEAVNSTTELSIAVNDDKEIQRLNKLFLGIDAPTDVLSFPSEEINPETTNPYLGDIILSYPRAKQQAELAGESVEDEIQLLVIHGVLHLLGYDHTSQEEKIEMWAVQQSALDLLGCQITHLPE